MERIWWERVPDAIAFVEDVANALLDEKSVLLQEAHRIPWYSGFAFAVQEEVEQKDASKGVERISQVENPGKYLFEEYCIPEIRALYRPSRTFANFLAENDGVSLHSKYFWVEVETAEALKAWTDFVSEYLVGRGKQKKEAAAFVLEWRGERSKISRKGIRSMSLDEYINEYDRMVFSMLASSTVREEVGMKHYLAELAANVAGNDVELCAECLDRYQEFLENPWGTLREITENAWRSNGEPFVGPADEAEAERLIWRAQIKTLYPLVEEFRGAFARKYTKAIAKELPVTAPFGETFDDPKDVELGTLVFMVASGRLKVKANEYARLVKCKDARNKLAHLRALGIEEIRELLGSGFIC